LLMCAGHHVVDRELLNDQGAYKLDDVLKMWQE